MNSLYRLIRHTGCPGPATLLVAFIAALLAMVVFAMAHEQRLVDRCQADGGAWDNGNPVTSWIWISTGKSGYMAPIITYPNARCLGAHRPKER